MKLLGFRRSRSEADFSTLNLNVIESLVHGKRMKLSKTSYQLFGNKDAISATASRYRGDGKEREENYYPKCDPSVWMRTCEEEVIEPIRGRIIGEIPLWLNGTLLRNGPGSLKVGKYRFDHLFDSSALLHRFGISNGKVTYQRRFVQTEVYKKNKAAQRIVVTEFGTKAVPDPCQSIFQRVATTFNPAENSSDNSMISVYPIGDEYYTFTEVPVIHRIDPETLETIGKVNISEYVTIVNHTSHPHIMKNGTVYNMGMSLTPRGPTYNVVRFSQDHVTAADFGKEKSLSMFEQATIVAKVPSRWLLNPSYMHTFGITENYFIIVEQPLAISLLGVMSCHIKQEPLSSALKWHENENTLIHVVSRKTGTRERTFIAETFFYLHIINQFETQDRDYIVLDICCYRDAKMLDCMYVDIMKNLHKNPDYANLFRGRPLRFVLPMKHPQQNVPLERNLITINTVNQANTHSSEDAANTARSEHGPQRLDTDDYGKPGKAKASAHRLPDGNIFVKPELLCDLGCETPRLNSESYLGKEYRYFYAISSDVDIDNPGTIIKVDTVNKTKKTWCEENAYPSEPIFVPAPDGKNEDDGVVLSALVWAAGHETEVGLLILDAVSFQEIARATFDTPGPVPKCLHGWFSLSK